MYDVHVQHYFINQQHACTVCTVGASGVSGVAGGAGVGVGWGRRGGGAAALIPLLFR